MSLKTALTATFLVVQAAVANAQLVHQRAKLAANDGVLGGSLGWAIAEDEGLLVVGAPRDDDNGISSGSAFVFDIANGQLLAQLLPVDGAEDDLFGSTVDISAGMVVVGAPGDDDSGSSSGSAYIFNALDGQQLRKLVPTDGAPGDTFGCCVSITSNVVAIGAPNDDDNGQSSGSVYIFDSITWDQSAKLIADDAASFDQFGRSVALDGPLLAVGAPVDNVNGTFSGSVYLFDVMSQQQLMKIVPDDGMPSDFFGESLALSGGLLAVGAPQNSNNGVRGSAYVFDAGTGDQVYKFDSIDVSVNSEFGVSVAINDQFVAVGAWDDNVYGSRTGSCHLYSAETGNFVAELLQSADEGEALDQLGKSVTLVSDCILVGVPGDDESGAVFAYDLNACSPADLASPLWTLDFSDVTAFLVAYSTVTLDADLAPPVGVWDFSDVIAYLVAFAAGCP